MLRSRNALNAALLLAVVICALSVVTSQHKTRKLYIELQKEKERAQQMDVEWGQLQLEQSTWATPLRVEKIAAQHLQMRVPKTGEVRLIRLEQSSTTSSSANRESESGWNKPGDRPLSLEGGRLKSNKRIDQQP